MTDDDKKPHQPIGWTRAILTAAVIVVIGTVVLVYGSNGVLRLHGKTRTSLVGIVTPLFFVVLVAMAWALRQLQRRKII